MESSPLFNSLAVAALATVVALAAGLPVALTLPWAAPGVRRALIAGALLVLALPGFLVAGMWMELVGFAGAWRVGEGWWTLRLLPLGLSGFVLGLLLWPIPALLLAGVWDRLDLRLLEANPELAGAALLRHGLAPVVRGPAASAALLVAVLALGNFAVPALFQARVWPAEIWVEFSTRFDSAAALGRCWPLAPFALALAAVALGRPLVWPLTAGTAAAGLYRRRLGPGLLLASGLGTALTLALSAGLPLALAVGNPRTWRELGPAWAASAPAAVRSLVFAAAAATLVLALGMLLATRREPVLLAPAFVLPGVFVGLLVLGAFTWRPLAEVRGTWLIVLAAFALRYAFVGWFLARRLWRGADAALRDVARLEGAGVVAQWRHVVAPRAGAALAGAWLVVYLLCLWDVETLILVVPPGGDTLALTIFNLLHYGHNAQVTALGLFLALVAALPVVLWSVARLARRLRLRHRLRAASGPAAVILAGLALLALVPGCSPRPPESVARLDSQLFERVEVIGARGTGPGHFLKPRSVTVDGADHLFVVDMTGRVQRFDPEGRWVSAWQLPETDKGKGKGMAMAPDGSVLVVEPHYHRVNRFDSDGRLLAQWGRHGTNAGELWFPRAIAARPDGELLVSEYGMVERVQRFRADGAGFLGAFGTPGTAPGQFNRAEGLGLDTAGNVYVADSCNHRIQVFGPDGRWLRAHGRAGRQAGEFSYPYDVRVDAAGRQYVCEFGNSRVQILDSRDRVLEILGGPGQSPDRMNNPWSLCLDSRGNLYVADSLNHRVLKFVRRST